MIEIPKDILELAAKLSKPIEVLNLDVRTYRCLFRWGIKGSAQTVGELIEDIQDGRIAKVRGIGAKSIYEIEHAIDSYIGRDKHD